VFSSFTPLTIGEYNYALMAEIDVEEALRSAVSVRNNLISSTVIEGLVLLAVSAVMVLFLAFRLIKPLYQLGKTYEELSEGEGDLTIQLKLSGIPEIDMISNGFNAFIGQIREIIEQVKIDADSLSSASQELGVITSQTAEKTSAQRDQTHMVSTSMEQLSQVVADVSKSTSAD
jgi:methyl-accepting chemotaxis protein